MKGEPLAYNKIEKLFLSNGIFSNETINYISQLKFENLKILDLSSNQLSSLDFIEKIDFKDKKNVLKKLIINKNDISIEEKNIE